MNKKSQVGKKIHLSTLDEFLASTLVESKEKPIKLAIYKEGTQGYISAVLLTDKEVPQKPSLPSTEPVVSRVELLRTGLITTPAPEDMEEDGIDFELSPCECIDLDSMEISDFLNKPIFTSSAYELFDFVFMFFDSLECLVDFAENTWKIKILKESQESEEKKKLTDS